MKPRIKYISRAKFERAIKHCTETKLARLDTSVRVRHGLMNEQLTVNVNRNTKRVYFRTQTRDGYTRFISMGYLVEPTELYSFNSVFRMGHDYEHIEAELNLWQSKGHSLNWRETFSYYLKPEHNDRDALMTVAKALLGHPLTENELVRLISNRFPFHGTERLLQSRVNALMHQRERLKLKTPAEHASYMRKRCSD